MTHIKPTVLAGKFTCPHCNAISEQKWWGIDWDKKVYAPEQCDIRVSKCVHCGENTLWINSKMYFPDTGSAPTPNSEMPVEVKNLYLEASSIQNKSPRGAAALLRLAIQVLCKELGEPGKNINEDIANLVGKGLNELIQQSLDIVRVTGNDAVHPGQIDTDDPETVVELFQLINVIVDSMIALPKKVSGIYKNLPANKIAAIAERDK
jgi:hypothetical protein